MHPPADLLIILQVAFLSIGLTLNMLAWTTGVFPINVLGVCFTVYGMLMSPRIHLPAAFLTDAPLATPPAPLQTTLTNNE